MSYIDDVDDHRFIEDGNNHSIIPYSPSPQSRLVRNESFTTHTGIV